MAETKDYNPKTANIVCQYQVVNDNDRLFIPMLYDTTLDTGPTTMVEQLAQCKRLSPHGTSKDVQPDGPLEFYQSGSINGKLEFGKTLTAQPGKAKGGEPEYVYTYQWQKGPSGTGPWSAISGANTTTYVIKTADVDAYFMFETTVTDSLSTKATTVTAQSWGPVADVYASVFGPETPVNLYTGHTTAYSWSGSATYNLGFTCVYKDSGGVYRTMVEDTDYAAIINADRTDGTDLVTCKWKRSDHENMYVTVEADFTQSPGVAPLELEGCATDTYAERNTSTCASPLVINFIGFS